MYPLPFEIAIMTVGLIGLDRLESSSQIDFDTLGTPNPLLFQRIVPNVYAIGSEGAYLLTDPDERSPWVGLLSVSASKYTLIESVCDTNSKLYTNHNKWPLLKLSAGKCWDAQTERIPREVMQITGSGHVELTAIHNYVRPVYDFGFKGAYQYLELVDVIAKPGDPGLWQVGFSSVLGPDKTDKFALSEFLLKDSDSMEFPIVSVNSPHLKQFECFLSALYPSWIACNFLEGIKEDLQLVDVMDEFIRIHAELGHDLHRILDLYSEVSKNGLFDQFHRAWVDGCSYGKSSSP